MNDQKKKQKQLVTKQNVLESLKDIGGSTADEFFKQLIGIQQKKAEKRSGVIGSGESLSMASAMSGQEEENRKLKLQIINERNLSAQESQVSRQKIEELRVHLQALMTEVAKLATSTGELAQSAQKAAFQAPANPGIYHITFFENVISFLQSFRKKIDQSSLWLNSANKRSEKKNYWSMYKKKGSSFLLSPDHYLQRSAG